MSRRLLAATLVASMLASLLVGCSSGQAPAPTAASQAKPTAATQPTAAAPVKPATAAPTQSAAAPAPGKTTVIKMAHPDPLDHPMHPAFEKFKADVEKKTNGALKVEIYGNMALGADREITEGVQMGSIQMGTSSTPNLAQFTDAFFVIDLPFLFPKAEIADKVLDGPIGQDLIKKLSAKGIKGLAYTEIGYRQIFNSKRPTPTLEELKGLKIRATGSPVHIAVLKALGVNPTPMGWGEVFTALQQNVVDGIDIDINLAWTSRFQEVQKYVVLDGASYSPHLLMINQKFFDGLPADQQKVIVEASQEMRLYERKLIRDNEAKMIADMKKMGIQVAELAPAERQKWVEATKPVYKEFESKIGKDLIEQVQKAAAQ